MSYDAHSMFGRKLTKEQLDFLADKLIGYSNWAIGGFVFGHLAAKKASTRTPFWMFLTSLNWRRSDRVEVVG